MRFSLFLTSTALVLSACVGPTINQFQLTALNKGMSQAEVMGRLQQEPRGAVSATVDGRNFEVSRYLFNNGMNHDVYYLAYESAKLVYWGYSSDYRRHPDKTMSRLMDEAIPKFGPIR